jgi:hypothetical protein
MSEKGIRKFTQGITWALLVMLLAAALLLQLHLVADLDFDGELLSTDAESLYGLRCARNGESPYHDFSRPPHAVALYGPLFYTVPGTIARLLNTSWIGTVVCGRCYTYAAWLGVGLVIYALARQAGCDRPFAAVAGLLWFSGTLAPQWAIAYRPDTVAVLLSLGALWAYQRGQQPMAVAAAVALLVAAFLHKQTSVAVLLVIVVAEIGRGRVGRAAAVLGGWTICVLAAVTATQVLTDGAFVKNAFGAAMLWVAPGQVWAFLREAIVGGAAAFAGGALAYGVTRGDGRLRLLRLGFAVSFELAVVTSIKAGANLNYYLEPFAMACVLTGGLLRDGTQPATGRCTRRLCLGWLGLAIGVSATILWLRMERLPERWHAVLDHRAARARQAQAWDRLAACLGELNERVLVEDLYLAVHQSRHPFALHPLQLDALRSAGRFDDSELYQRIADGGFDAVIATFPLEEQARKRQFPSRWLDAARGRYVLEKRCAGSKPDETFYVYRPASPRS